LPCAVFYEEQDTRLIRTGLIGRLRAQPGVRVVDRGSADPGIPGLHPVPFDADHFSICKPTDEDDHLYLAAVRFLQRVLDVARPHAHQGGAVPPLQGGQNADDDHAPRRTTASISSPLPNFPAPREVTGMQRPTVFIS